MKDEPRFDVLWNEHGPFLDYHFCRDWDPDPDTGEITGCYGTKPDHGFSFEEAKAEIAAWHEKEAARWRSLTLKEWGHEEIESGDELGSPVENHER